MDRRPDEFCFAAVGDVHGQMHRMVRCVQDGFERVPHFRYLGRVGVVELHGLRVAGLSGIQTAPAQAWARRRSTPRTASAAAMMEMPRKRISTPNTTPSAHIEEAGNREKMMAPSATDTRP